MKTLYHSLVLAALLSGCFCNTLFAQWKLQSTVPEVGDYPSVSVFSSTGLVIAGGNLTTAKVYKSTNSGATWTDITGNLAGAPRIISLCAFDQNTIYAGDGGNHNSTGGDAKVWKTTNGGLNWNVIFSTGGTYGYINGIAFSKHSDQSFGIIASDPPNGPGQPFWIRKTTDGGQTWQNANASGVPGSFGSDHTLFAIDSMFYGFGINPGAASYITTNGGQTWSNRTLSIPGNYTTGLSFSFDRLNGIGLSDISLPAISRTTNGGVNWIDVYTGSNLSGMSRAKCGYGANICFITSSYGSSGSIIMSTDFGANWVTQTTAGVNNLYDIDLFNINGFTFAYAISANGSVISYQNVTGIEPVSGIAPSKFNLEQNYPNPFNPATKIKYDILNEGMVKLAVYDLLGRELTSVVNEYQKPGSYEVKFDGDAYSSGVYFYKLSANGFSETRKMILSK